jgi:hypothetical protein
LRRAPASPVFGVGRPANWEMRRNEMRYHMVNEDGRAEHSNISYEDAKAVARDCYQNQRLVIIRAEACELLPNGQVKRHKD